jgi:hypothetical protein
MGISFFFAKNPAKTACQVAIPPNSLTLKEIELSGELVPISYP